MTLREFQKQSVELIEKIDAKHSGKHDPETTIIHLLEELGELARQLFNLKIGRDNLNKENLAEEISDCMLLLAQLAHNFNIDIEDSYKKKLEELKKRFDL